MMITSKKRIFSIKILRISPQILKCQLIGREEINQQK